MGWGGQSCPQPAFQPVRLTENEFLIQDISQQMNISISSRAGTLTRVFALLALASLSVCFAVETKFWQQGDRTDFEKGTLRHLSLRSDGRIFLGPEFPEVFDSSTPYLWAIASDSKGNLYTAGGGSGSGSAKLFVLDSSGKSRTLAELEGLEIHAIAVDSNNDVYAATDPDGKIYKITPAGKSSVFYDPHQKYIWTMAFNSKGDLFVATGDQGEIHRVTRDGKGSVFFKTEETHARSLAIDAQDNLVVGTEPGGLILRVSPAGQGFVLYQAPKREITAVAIARDGSIYAAGVGSKTPALTIGTPTPPPVPVPSGPGNAPASGGGGPSRNTPPPSLNTGAPAISGGSEVYRINPDGSPRRAWSNSQDIVYAIGFDQSGQTLLGTGNKGKIYRLDSDVLSTLLVDASPTQVTGFGRGSRGELYVVTGNIGRVYRLGAASEKSGSFESDVLDAGAFAYWGRIGYRGTGNIHVFTRSGNLNRPENNWSAWAPLADSGATAVCESCGGGRTNSPSARFLQFKFEIAASSNVPSPDVSYVEIAYLPKNVAPTIDEIEVTPPNYKFPTPLLSIPPSTSITLPALGQHRRASASTGLDSGSTQTLNYAKGHIGVRWAATDENGDSLIYKVEIRGVKESGWKLLKEGVKEKFLSWDSTAFPDGEYVLRVTASDAPSNPRNDALEATLVGDPFLIDNTPPQILNLAAATSGNKIEVRWKARDARSDIDKAEYSVNGGEWLLIPPVTKLSDSPEEDYHLTIDRPGPGEQVIAVRVTDEYDNQTVDKVVIK
jgi:sugar lactone lactonase YvrE